jgi:hypothetical protein
VLPFFVHTVLCVNGHRLFTVLDAALGEVLTTVSKMDWLLKHGERVLSPEKRTSTSMLFYKSGEVHYEPLGVVSAIVSWNYREPPFYARACFLRALQPYTTPGHP